jgi:hypothetical protein
MAFGLSSALAFTDQRKSGYSGDYPFGLAR